MFKFKLYCNNALPYFLFVGLQIHLSHRWLPLHSAEEIFCCTEVIIVLRGFLVVQLKHEV